MSDTAQTDSRTAWTEPGPEDLGGGVYRIPLPLPNDGLRAVNVYLMHTPDGLVLIDGGWSLAQSAELLRTSLRQLGFDLSEISRFLVTHLHRDHYTQAVALRREVGARVGLGDGERTSLTQVREWITSGQRVDDFQHLRRAGAQSLLDQVRALSPGGDQTNPADWELPDEWLTGGTELVVGERRLQVISTPGHTAGHLVFHDRQAKLLFAGDHVLPHITPSIGFEPVRTAFPLRDYLDSLKLMHTLPDARLLPAHGPVTASVHQRVTELLSHHEDRLDSSAAVVVAGAATAFEAANALAWTRRKRAFADLDLFNQILAVAETAAHLDVLVLQGRLNSAANLDGVAIYQP
ncbi:MAG: MBL fold metallo-hydrolase [Actinomycetota bacterium]|nr:MBL fold metallo-hydrolase [Actinomycetota bacterium]